MGEGMAWHVTLMRGFALYSLAYVNRCSPTK